MTPAARPYAEALFSLLRQREDMDAVVAEIGSVARALTEVPQARDLLVHPGASPKVAGLLLEGLSAGRSLLVGNLLRLLFHKGRMGLLPDIADGVQARLDAAEGRVRARAQTARPMSELQAVRLHEALSHRLGKTVHLDFEQHSELIGGVRVVFGDRVLDGSLAGGLESLRRRLVADRI